ncbi:hypothetical protein CTI14_24630 [Methylobacterium radiotolerans]|nr:hypothetical protein CTI14_24630 [Methylobacterium radiotolerans]
MYSHTCATYRGSGSLEWLLSTQRTIRFFLLTGRRLGAEGEGKVGGKSSTAKFIAYEYASLGLRPVELDKGLVALVINFFEPAVEVEIR